MSAELLDAIDGIVTIEVTGRLSLDELAEVHRQTAAALEAWGGGGLLILARDFEGWTGDSDWETATFQTANDPMIRKMAIVGDARWEQLALVFTAKGLRPFPIEYFPPSRERDARVWMNS